jgi:hypothetical protein
MQYDLNSIITYSKGKNNTGDYSVKFFDLIFFNNKLKYNQSINAIKTSHYSEDITDLF